MSSNMMSYRVCYKLKEDSAEVIVDFKTDSLEQVYESICSVSGVKDTMDLAYLEIHALRIDGKVEVTMQTSQPRQSVEEEEDDDGLWHKLESHDDDWEVLSIEDLIEEEIEDD